MTHKPGELLNSVLGVSELSNEFCLCFSRRPMADSRQPLYCTFCNRAISFCTRFSSESDHKTRPLIPQCFSTAEVNATSFCTLAFTRSSLG